MVHFTCNSAKSWVICIHSGLLRFTHQFLDVQRGKVMIAGKRIVLFTAALIALAVMCWGQGTTGTITGVVRDPNGATIPNAKVVARNVDTAAEAVATTDTLGSYVFPNLSPGTYTLTVEVTGFRKSTVAAQRLTVGDVVRQDVQLEIGQVTESVTVEAR